MSFTLIRSEWMPGIPCSICRGRFRHRMPHVFGLYFDEDSEPGRTIWKTLLKLGWEAR